MSNRWHPLDLCGMMSISAVSNGRRPRDRRILPPRDVSHGLWSSRKGGDRFRRGYWGHCRMSSSRELVKVRENATANQELALAA